MPRHTQQNPNSSQTSINHNSITINLHKGEEKVFSLEHIHGVMQTTQDSYASCGNFADTIDVPYPFKCFDAAIHVHANTHRLPASASDCWWGADYHSFDSPNASRIFALGASNVCLVGENPTCSVQRCRDARANGHTTTFMYDNGCTAVHSLYIYMCTCIMSSPRSAPNIFHR